MRDKTMLHLFLDRLHKDSALSVPPEDLIEAVDLHVTRFHIAEKGGPGYEELEHTKAALVEMDNLNAQITELESAEEQT